MRFLVTGGAGFIGSNLAMELQRRGHGVVILDHFTGTGRFENLSGFSGDIVAADVFKAQDWIYRVGPVDGIFHEAAITDTTVMDQKRMLEVNVEGFRNLLDFAAEAGVKKVVYASSAATYGFGKIPMAETQALAPANIYGFSKRVMEEVAASFTRDNPEIKVAGLRYFNVYGSGESYKGSAASMIWQLSRQVAAGKAPRIFKWGEQFRDFIYIKDVVTANLKAFESEKNGVYNVCAGSKTTFNRIIEVLNDVMGTSAKPEYFDNPYSFYQNETLGNPAFAEQEIGFKAQWSIEDGIRDYLGGKEARKHAVAA